MQIGRTDKDWDAMCQSSEHSGEFRRVLFSGLIGALTAVCWSPLAGLIVGVLILLVCAALS